MEEAASILADPWVLPVTSKAASVEVVPVTIDGESIDFCCLPSKAAAYKGPWASVWASGALLSEISAIIAPHSEGVSVLELGCGQGLAALVNARKCKWKEYVATDMSQEALTVCNANLQPLQPATSTPFITAKLSWSAVESDKVSQLYDVIFAADCLYIASVIPAFLHCVKAYLAPTGAALVIDPGRPSTEEFVAAAQTAGFIVEERVITDLPLSFCTMPKANVWLLRHRLTPLTAADKTKEQRGEEKTNEVVNKLGEKPKMSSDGTGAKDPEQLAVSTPGSDFDSDSPPPAAGAPLSDGAHQWLSAGVEDAVQRCRERYRGEVPKGYTLQVAASQ